MKIALSYSLKVWLTTVILVPFLQIISHTVTVRSVQDVVTTLTLTFLYSFFLSIPSWLGLWVVILLFNKLTISVIYFKVCLSLVGFGLAILPFILLTHNLPTISNPDFLWVILYPLTIVASIWFYKLKPLNIEQAIS
jgi:hypothetical protein